MVRSTNPLYALTERIEAETTLEHYRRVRVTSLDLVAPLTVEDMVVQSMPDASPIRWHLAHTTWFFEHFLLAANSAGFRPYREGWGHLFNSYYYSVGDMHKRPQRGLLSRPTVAEVLEYRVHVDTQMAALIEANSGNSAFSFLVELGLNHEQQHQELMILHWFLKHCGSNVRSIMLTICNRSWRSGIFPSKWKLAIIKPILKANKSSNNAESYRPICMLYII